MGLTLVPVSLSDALAFVARVHRTHRSPQGGKFAIGVAADDEIVGVAVVGRPVARHLDNGWTAEVTRVATVGTPNACSKLYGACWRAARALGYRRLVTYTLQEESGTSLRAAGWKVVGETKPETWDRPNRPRVDRHPSQTKFRWEATA